MISVNQIFVNQNIGFFGKLSGWLPAIAVMFTISFVSACDLIDDSGNDMLTPGEEPEMTVLSSQSLSVKTYTQTSLTLATSETTFAYPGDTVGLLGYVYVGETDVPAAGGSIEFSAEIETRSGLVEVPIGIVPLQAGRATTDWETPDEYAGNYRVFARYLTDGQLAPSQWQFPLYITRPNREAAVIYSMARLNHIVNLMHSRSGLDNVLVGGPTADLEQTLRNEFDLQLLESFYRAESSPEDVTFPDVAKTLEAAGITRSDTIELCVRTTLIVAASENVLVVIIKGTDGEPNSTMNEDAGSPSAWPDGSDIAVHPGWAWMADKLVNGFAEARCGDDDWANPDFPGLAELINRHRVDPVSGTVRRLYITGHSLGGAQARMTGVQMASTAMAAGDRVYTFGSPWQGAYNNIFDLRSFESYAESRLAEYGIEYFAMQGNRDRVPGFGEETVSEKWDDNLSNFAGFASWWVTIGRSARCVFDEISSWFGASDGCDDRVSERPIGYDSPRRTLPMTSSSHQKLDTSLNGIVDAEGKPVYYSTDVSDKFTARQAQAHWVGDYEFATKRRLRGNPARYNFYFPASSEGSIRQPLEIEAL